MSKREHKQHKATPNHALQWTPQSVIRFAFAKRPPLCVAAELKRYAVIPESENFKI